jgi:hypothetical protein
MVLQLLDSTANAESQLSAVDLETVVTDLQAWAQEDGIEVSDIADSHSNWCATKLSSRRVELHNEPYIVLALALRLMPNGRLAYPNMRLEGKQWVFRPTIRSSPEPLLLCPAVLCTLQLLPSDIKLDQTSLDAQSTMLERPWDESPPTDAMPHNIGWKSLVWSPETSSLRGISPVMFDRKYTCYECCWTVEGGPLLSRQVRNWWYTATLWSSILAEFDRQPYLRRDYTALYTQFWSEAQGRASLARGEFLKVAHFAIKLDFLQPKPRNTAHLISSLNPRENS